MRNILIFGVGKSTSVLIDYLISKSSKENFCLTLIDRFFSKSLQIKLSSYKQTSKISCITLDIFKQITERQQYVEQADLVISMMPAHLHIEIAKDCIKSKTNLLTASYISEQMHDLNQEVEKNDLTFINEAGLDPGLDHMSAMDLIDKIRSKGGKITHFESFTGGLIADETCSNLWKYKFTWNPRNVVLAGSMGAATFLEEGKFKYIPYQKLFRRTEFLDIPNYGRFEAYANRDSLPYKSIYGLQNARTIFRGTIRRVGFCRAWNVFVQLGMTSDNYTLLNKEKISFRDFTNAFLPYHPTDSVELKLRHYLKIDQDDELWYKLLELNLFDKNQYINIANPTPAQALQYILEKSWTLKQHDKDRVVMYHRFHYEINNTSSQLNATLVQTGEDHYHTAMAKTVGLPLGIIAILLLNKKITKKGVILPIYPEIYKPVLEEIKNYDVHFTEF